MDLPSLEWIDFKPSEYRGAWPVLALFMIVSETLLGLWLGRASTSSERVVAGVLMTVIFLAFLIVTVLIVQTQKQSDNTVVKDLPKPVAPATEVVSEPIEAEAELIADPRGTFTLKKPPPDWTIKELSTKEWIAESAGITDPAAIEAFVNSNFGPMADDSQILMLKSPRHISVIPVTGLTRLDGRKHPSALELIVPTRLGIIPLERAVPPLYVERSLAQNFLQVLTSFQGMGLLSLEDLRNGTIKGGREIILAEFTQRVENAIINGEPGQNITLRIALMGIAGNLTDYLLFMNYGKLEKEDPVLSRDLEDLVELVNSFRPVEVVDTEERRRELAQKADQLFDELMAEHGEDAFIAELGIAAARLAGKDMDDPQARDQAIRQLEPFETFSKNIRMNEGLAQSLEDFWDALDRAKRGDASDFKQQLAELIDDFLSSDEADSAEHANALTARAENTKQISGTAIQSNDKEEESSTGVNSGGNA